MKRTLTMLALLISLACADLVSTFVCAREDPGNSKFGSFYQSGRGVLRFYDCVGQETSSDHGYVTTATVRCQLCTCPSFACACSACTLDFVPTP